MSLEAGRVFVRLATVTALVRPAIGNSVRRGSCCKQFVANLPDVTVGGNVSVEVGRVSECLVTMGALVGRGRAVGCLVLLEVSLLTESLVTYPTLKWSLPYNNQFKII